MRESNFQLKYTHKEHLDEQIAAAITSYVIKTCCRKCMYLLYLTTNKLFLFQDQALAGKCCSQLIIYLFFPSIILHTNTKMHPSLILLLSAQHQNKIRIHLVIKGVIAKTSFQSLFQIRLLRNKHQTGKRSFFFFKE